MQNLLVEIKISIVTAFSTLLTKCDVIGKYALLTHNIIRIIMKEVLL